MRRRLSMAATLFVLAVAAAARCSHALDCTAAAIVSSSNYGACQSATRIDFTVNGTTVLVDPAVFCSSADCVSLWGLLHRLGALQCLQPYDAGSYTLKDELSAQSCFRAFAASPMAVPATTKAIDGQAASRVGDVTLESATIGATPTNSSTPSASRTPSIESPATNESDSDLQGTSRSALWIALASCGGSVVLLIMLSVYIRRRRAKELEAKIFECLEQSGRDHYIRTRPSPCSPPSARGWSTSSNVNSARPKRSPKLVCLDDDIIVAVRIPYGKLTLNSLVSRGGFGEVYRGMYRGKPVAIKRLLPEKRYDVCQIENFLDEVKLMASLEHEHIVRFVGVAWETIEELCVVSEFMALGDLRALLSTFDLDEDAHPKGFGADKLKIALHVAKALTYMHSLDPIVLHRDIKSRNILLDTNLDAKVTDFGVSRERTETTMTTGVGSTLWMAPEVMSGGRYNEKADVFSFGVVLSELDTHRIPYSHVVESGRGRRLPDTVIVQMMTLDRVRVEFSDEDASPMAQLGRRCVQLDPSKRPSAKEVEEFIHERWNKVVVAL